MREPADFDSFAFYICSLILFFSLYFPFVLFFFFKFYYLRMTFDIELVRVNSIWGGPGPPAPPR